MRYGFDEINKRMKKAITNHGLIEDDTPIMVGLSGGKDSLTLLYALKQFQRISKYKYSLSAGHVSLGFPDDSIELMKSFCQSLNVPFFWEKTQIGEVVFEARQEKNPCSLCAKMRRGALNSLAKHNGYKKIALAHHQDDAVETLILNLFFEGRAASFKPYTYLDRMDIIVIRPFVYVPETQITYFARKNELPISKSNCPHNFSGMRQEIKKTMVELEALSPMGKDRVTSALDRLFGKDWDGN